MEKGILKDILTKSDYEEYVKRFKSFMENEGLSNLSLVDYESEPHFSWSNCDCCNRPLGGMRQDCSGYIPKLKEISIQYSICDDCYYFAEYGRLDDMTMMKVEENK